MTKITEQATLVDMPAVGIKRKLPKLPEGRYYIQVDASPVARIKRNKRYSIALDSYAKSTDIWVRSLQSTLEDSAYINKQDRKTIINSLFGLSRTLLAVADIFRLDHDVDTGIAVPLPDGLTFEQVEIEGEEE